MMNSCLVDQIMAYEAGEMDLEETVEFFQSLIDEDVLPHLQGHYHRTARDLYQAGYLRKD